MLEYLHLKNVGPAPEMELELTPRLNLLTGDNGLGKSFLLDVAWWALTREWAGHRVMPSPNSARKPSIKFVVASGTEARPVRAAFSRTTSQWELPKQLPAVSGLVIYARVD